MPEIQSSASTSSLPSVSKLPSTKTSHTFTRRSTNLWLPLSPFPILNEEGHETKENIIASPHTPTSFCWELEREPEPKKIEFNDQTMSSVFEDWEDPLLPSSAVYIELDGTQTLLITPQSAFFYPPPSPRPFGYEPFSKGLFGPDQAVFSDQQLDDDSESTEPILLTPKTFEHVSTMAPPKQPKGILFVDTNNTLPSFGYSEWSASIFCSPKHHAHGDEAASWAPKGLIAYGPDVPLDFDCIYSAGDVSPVERWDEKLWSPVSLRKGLRTAPCV